MDIHKQRVFFLVAITWLGWLVPVLTGAAGQQDLFEVEMTVPDQLAVTRDAVIRPALQEVLVRVAGNASVLQTEQAVVLLQDPGKYVQQYRYFTVPDTQPPVLKLWLRFDADLVRQSLQQQGLPYWGSERPDTLVWLAVEESGSRYLVSADDDGEVHRQFSQAAQERGVPVLFPLLDLVDQSHARFADIWGGFFDRVLDASARYSPQAVLIGRLNRDGSGGWTARWHMVVDGQPASWSNSGNRLDSVLLQGMSGTADRFASRFAVAGSGGSITTVNVTVSDVNTLAAYARINEYFDTLTSVVRSRVGKITGKEVEFVLELNGNLQDLNRTISIGTVLEPLPGGMPGTYRIRQ